MQSLTRFALRHKRAVAVAWILATLVGMAAAGPASEALDQRFSVPGREGWETSQEIAERFGNGGELLPFVPVVQFPEGATVRSPVVREELRALQRRTQEAVPGSRVAGYGSTADAAFVSEDGRTAFVCAFPRRSDEPFGANVEAMRDLREALARVTVADAPVRLTGYDALFDSSGEGAEGPGVLLEALIGGFGR